MSITWHRREHLFAEAARIIEHVDVVLDVGCGVRPQKFFSPAVHICCEPHQEYIEVLKTLVGNDPRFVFLQRDWEEVLRLLPDKSVDSVFILDVIEHLKKQGGRCLLKESERVARRQLVVFTPLGFMPQEAGDVDAWGLTGVKWQKHQSGWLPHDFDKTWKIFACKEFHLKYSSGEECEPPFGAFFAIKTLPEKLIKSSGKFAVVSHVLPPSPSGQAIMLYRLLAGFSPRKYCLISKGNYDYRNYKSGWLYKLPSRYYTISPSFSFPVPKLPLLSLFVMIVNFFLNLVSRTRQIARVLRAEACKVVVTCSGDVYDIPSAFLASRILRIPCLVYIFDDYVHQWAGLLPESFHFFIRLIAPPLLKGSDAIIVANAFIRREYRRRYHRPTFVVSNPAPSQDEIPSGDVKITLGRHSVNIVYTGAIYRAHYDAFLNLVTALYLTKQTNVKLNIFTNQPLTELEARGISGPKVIYHPHVPHAAVQNILKQADILFLPLAFDSPFPEVIKTSAPGKTGEYLAAGKPILVHAPRDSFIGWYFSRHACGLVVNENDAQILAHHLSSLIKNTKLKKQLSLRAKQRAAQDFDLEKMRGRFRSILSLVGEG